MLTLPLRPPALGGFFSETPAKLDSRALLPDPRLIMRRALDRSTVSRTAACTGGTLCSIRRRKCGGCPHRPSRPRRASHGYPHVHRTQLDELSGITG